MAIFKLHNYTRYNTSDLLALLDSVEACVHATRVVKPGNVRIYGMLERYWPEIHVLYRKSGESNERVSSGLRETFPVLLIVRPEDLYDSPLSALASTVGVATVPEPVRDDIAERLFDFYSTGNASTSWRVKRGLFESWKKHRDAGPPGGLAIRIENNNQESESKADKKRWSDRKRVSRAVRKTAWAVASIRRNMKLVERGILDLTKVEAVLSPTERDIHVAVSAFINQHAALEKAVETLYPQEE